MATVMNAGDPGRPLDKGITPKNLAYPFQANNETAVIIAVGTASTTTALPRSQVRGRDDCIRMINTGSAAVRVRFGADSTVVATLQDKAIAPGATEIFRLTPNRNFIATIGAAASTLECNMGAGL